MKKPLIIYHSPCIDGFSAAWWAFRSTRGELFPTNYDKPPPQTFQIKDRDVYIVDFCYKPDVLFQMSNHARKIVVLDHHKTAKEDIKQIQEKQPKNLKIIFDMNRSGAGITWDYFAWSARHWLINAVEDRDLWRFQYKETKAQTAYIATFDQTIENWNYLYEKVKPKEAEERGQSILSFHNKVVKDTAQKVQMVKFEKDGPIVPVVNSLYEFNSELGNVLAKDNPYSVCWYMGESPTDVFISFRSSVDNPNYIDVSEVARRFGGGGHKHASGCQVSLDYIVSILKGEI